MRLADIQYKKIVLVCVNLREDEKACCSHKLSPDLYKSLKARIKDAVPNVRVSSTGCLGNCLSGAAVTIQPDNIWLGEVTEGDIDEIIELVKK